MSENKKELSYEKMCIRYNFLKGMFLALIIFISFLVYLNYDYMMFKILVARNYVFTETLDEIYKESLGEESFSEGNYSNLFDEVVMTSLTKTIRDKNNDKYTYLYTPKQYENSKKYTEEDAKLSEIKELDKNLVYINLPNISTGTRKFVYENKEELNKYDDIVIDLRNNYGGMLNDFYKISDLFLEKGSIIGYEKTRNKFFSKTIKAKKNKYFDFENIYILQDEKTASSAEGFILSLKENLDNVTLVGSTTFGKGIGQVTIPLKKGFAVKATVLKLEGPSKKSIHEKGIEADITIDEFNDKLGLDY